MARSGCKVCRVLSERELEHYDDRLVEEWQRDDAQRKGYRTLAEWLNVTLLRREMDRVGLSTTGGEPESKYDRLRSGDAIAEELHENLRREGLPIDELRSDFVSYGSVRTHIKECLGASRETSGGDGNGDGDGNWELDALRFTREHARGKASEAVTSLLNKGRLSACGDLSVAVSVELVCEDCQSRVPVDRAFRRGHVCHTHE